MTVLTSIYGHFRRLKLPTEPEAMNQVGLLVRDLYRATYGCRPLKKRRDIGGETIWVNVYPEEFTPQIVEVIRSCHRAQQLAGSVESQPGEVVPPAALVVAEENPKRIRQRIPIRVKTFDKVSSSDQTKTRGAS